MEEIYIKARAKINLNLEVLNKREDNYHNIESVFQKINLYDEMFIKKTNTNEFEMETNIEQLNNTKNIIYKAYIKLKEQYKNITGIKVILNKKIPMQAGMGGGSTDCASFIICMNKLFDLKLSKNKMESIGKKLGADVVPCFYNRAVIAEDIGDKITKINTNFKYYIVIIKPNISCDTKEMYKLIDEKNEINKVRQTDKIVLGLQKKDINMIADNLHNTFEYVIKDKDLINNIKDKFIENGAIGTLLTGSGSCVYGIFKNKLAAKSAYKNLKDKYQTYICTSYNSKRGEIF